MSVSHSRQTRAKRSRKAIDKAARKIEDVRSASGANLVYAGYPYDPYA
jgi:hypothetical protein